MRCISKEAVSNTWMWHGRRIAVTAIGAIATTVVAVTPARAPCFNSTTGRPEPCIGPGDLRQRTEPVPGPRPEIELPRRPPPSPRDVERKAQNPASTAPRQQGPNGERFNVLRIGDHRLETRGEFFIEKDGRRISLQEAAQSDFRSLTFKTGRNGHAFIHLQGGIIELRETSEFKSAGEVRGSFNLKHWMRGMLDTGVERLYWRRQNPSRTIMTVRGTIVGVTDQGSGSGRVSVYSGRVDLESGGSMVTVNTGEAVSIGPSGELGVPARIRTGFLFPDSYRRYLTEADLGRLTAGQLRYARNEIFARRGRYFDDEGIRAHFSQFEWYRPYTWEPPLSEIEAANVRLIQSLER